ncbi:MAG: hypothetical protein IMW89_16785 [Ktedonobacteraceae bacterium]|nr:hypothetical protein [Ktedonobacteraceae bacterium]
MRGKLRDKRAAEKRDYFKREAVERRRPGKRNRLSWTKTTRDYELEVDELDGDDEAEPTDPDASPQDKR